MSKSRELSPNEIEATKRLKKIWNEKKKDLNLSQEKLALECGWSGQSAFSQYYHGRVPLNTEAVLKLAKVLKVHPKEIMPEIAEFLPFNESENKKEFTTEEIRLLELIQNLTPEQKALIEQTANILTHTNQTPTTKAA